MDRTCPFYKEFEVGLLVWIHHHHRWCGRLIEKMGFMGWNLRSSLHVLRAMCRGLIMWNLWRIFCRIYQVWFGRPSIIDSIIKLMFCNKLHYTLVHFTGGTFNSIWWLYPNLRNERRPVSFGSSFVPDNHNLKKVKTMRKYNIYIYIYIYICIHN